MAFNVECLFKIWCLGWKGYVKRGLHKFELTLCIGSSLNVIKPLYDKNVFTYCQVRFLNSRQKARYPSISILECL